nr:MAG TPA: hypothetical protein [Caudoviricetes sp.]
MCKIHKCKQNRKNVTIMFDRYKYIAQSQYISTSIFKGGL